MVEINRVPRNGPQQPDLPEHRLKAIEYGNAAFQKTAHELDVTTKQLTEAQNEIARLKTQVGSLQEMITMWENRVQSAVSERDHAVADKVRLETIIQTTIKVWIEHVPAAFIVDMNQTKSAIEWRQNPGSNDTAAP
jgi:hypothetical protein